MLSAARCEKCNHALPLRGALLDFRLPPDSVPCPGCRHTCETILPYRVGWMESLLHKVFAVASVPVCLYVAFSSPRGVLEALAIAVLGPVIVGGLGGLLLSKLLGLPLTAVRDARRRSR